MGFNYNNLRLRFVGVQVSKIIFSVFVLLMMFASANAQTNVTLGNGDATNNFFPNHYNYNYSYTQTIYPASELMMGGAPGASKITKIRFMPTSAVSTAKWKDLVIYMANVTQDGFSSTANYVAPSAMTKVFSGSISSNTTANQWFDISLDSSFIWNGTDNILIAVDENTQGYGGNPTWASYTSIPNTSNNKRGIYFYQDPGDIDTLAPTASFSGAVNNVAQIQFEMTPTVTCTGLPSAGTTPTSFGICELEPFTIAMTGFTAAGGVSYSWQQRIPSGTGAWTNLVGFTSPVLNYPGGVFNESMDFRFIAKCDSSALSDTSNFVTVSLNPATACYCVPTTSYQTYYISSVTSSNASNNITYTQNSFPTGGYMDSSNAINQLQTYQTQSFDLDIKLSSTSSSKRAIGIWVDWGQDGSFDATDQLINDYSVIDSLKTYGITVPAGTPVGNYRMRVRYAYTTSPATSCGNTSYGSTVDYLLNVLAAPTCLYPTDLVVSTINDTSFTIDWQANGPATQWQVEYGPQGFVHGTGNDTIISTHPLTLSINPASAYDVYVRAICGASDTTGWSLPNSFVNSYCTFATSTSSTRFINDFSTTGGVQNIANMASGAGTNYLGYSDFTNLSLTAYPGLTITTKTEMGSSGTYGNAIFVDWNNNYIFDASEKVFTTTSYSSNPMIGNFVIPAVANGKYRMRIVGDYNSSTPGACSGSFSADAEDYIIQVISIPTCLPVTNIVKDSASHNALTISWTPGGTENTWKIEWGIPGFTPGTGTGIDSTTVHTPSDLITGLLSNTEYEIYIKADCGGGDISYWSNASFTTDCDVISAIDYCETFDALTDLDCWGVLDNNNDGDKWEFYSGAMRIKTDFNSGNDDDYLITPKLHLTGNEILKFSYKAQSQSEPSDLGVLISTSSPTPAGFSDTLLNYFIFNNTSYKDTIIDLSAYVGDVYISFHIPQGGLDGYYTYVDNVCFELCTPTVGIPGDTTVCNATGVIDLNSVINSPYNNGTWSFNTNPAAINGSQLDPSSLAVGSYQAKYVVLGGCSNDTTIATIHIVNEPSAGIGKSISICKNSQLNLFPLLSGTVDMNGHWIDYQQQTINGSSILAPNLQGSYNYFYITSNGVCGADTATVVITVDPSCDALSLSDVVLDNVNVYPNPAHSILNINNPSNLNNLKGELIDMKGKLVMNINKAMNEKTTISLENLQKGIYTLRLYNDEGQRIFKVVKE